MCARSFKRFDYDINMSGGTYLTEDYLYYGTWSEDTRFVAGKTTIPYIWIEHEMNSPLASTNLSILPSALMTDDFNGRAFNNLRYFRGYASSYKTKVTDEVAAETACLSLNAYNTLFGSSKRAMWIAERCTYVGTKITSGDTVFFGMYSLIGNQSYQAPNWKLTVGYGPTKQVGGSDTYAGQLPLRPIIELPLDSFTLQLAEESSMLDYEISATT